LSKIQPKKEAQTLIESGFEYITYLKQDETLTNCLEEEA